jgi:hypothetical protein
MRKKQHNPNKKESGQQDNLNGVNIACTDEELMTQLWGRLLDKIKTETLL